MARRNHSKQADFEFISRRILKKAAEKVRRGSGKAPGPDGRTHEQVFGRGRYSKQYKQTMRRLSRNKRSWCFGPTRPVAIQDTWSGKERVIEVPSFDDRIILAALTIVCREYIPPTSVMACQPGVDARYSVAMAAVAIRNGAHFAVRSDLATAFPSLRWIEVLQSPQAQILPDEARAALTAVYSYYSPTGRGVPMGLPCSPLMLDMACQKFDHRLEKLPGMAVRYVDDLLLIGNDEGLGDHLVTLVKEELEQYGLDLHPEKTGLYSRRLPNRYRKPESSQLPFRSFPLPWLGHEILEDGSIDIPPGPAGKINEASLSHFILASKGERYGLLQRNNSNPDNSKPQNNIQPAATPYKIDLNRGDHPVGITTVNNTWVYPTTAPGQDSADEVLEATDEHSGGMSLGRRGKEKPRRPWLRRSMFGLPGGARGLLQISQQWADTHHLVPADVVAEARILFNETPDKVFQFCRALTVWQQAYAILEKQGFSISPTQEERMLRRAWRVLVSAATLMMTEATSFCIHDPVEEVLLHLAQKNSTLKARSNIVQERIARKKRMRPTGRTLYAGLIGASIEHLPEERKAQAQITRSSFRVGRHSHKSQGMRAEKTVAQDVGGITVKGSGAGWDKGDVKGGGVRLEVKSTRGQRWRLPLYQLDQICTASAACGEIPAVIFSTSTKPVLALIPDGNLACLSLRIISRRNVSVHQKTLSVPLSTVKKLADGNIVISIAIGGRNWFLCSYELFSLRIDGGYDRGSSIPMLCSFALPGVVKR